MVKLAPPTKLPSLGISLGESGSDLFHISMPLRNNLSIFWELGTSGQYAKSWLIVIGAPLALVISMLSSVATPFVRGLSDIAGPQSGPVRAVGVGVGVNVFVGVKDAVGVEVAVGVFDGVGVFV